MTFHRWHHAPERQRSWGLTDNLPSKHFWGRCHGNDDEWAVYLRQTVREHRHSPAVGLPLWHVGEGDREVHQAGSGDQRAQERTSPVSHPASHHQGQTCQRYITQRQPTSSSLTPIANPFIVPFRHEYMFLPLLFLLLKTCSWLLFVRCYSECELQKNNQSLVWKKERGNRS